MTTTPTLDRDQPDEAQPADQASAPRPAELVTLPASWSVVVCCGPGGVGKTTVAASLAIEAARLGRRACVVTVDPARRLAGALGVTSLPNTPALVEGDWSGELHAVMLDAKGTFDDLVARYSTTEAQAQVIRTNRLYQNLSGALSGTQEYMAMEKLYELTESGRFDLVVVDTPPTRNALDLLDAPRRLTQFLENRVFRALMAPTRMYLRAVNVATQALLRTISRVAGAEIVQDAVAFFQAFAGMESGFHDRANAVRGLLADPGTGYVVVTSPRPDALEEAGFFLDRLVDRGIRPSGLVINRMQPRFGDGSGLPTAPEGSELAALVDCLQTLDATAAAEELAVAPLSALVAPAPVARVPLLASDVHDLAGLSIVTDQLFGRHVPGTTPTADPGPVQGGSGRPLPPGVPPDLG